MDNKYIGIKINLLNKGHVTLVDYMGTDADIVAMARVSFGKGTTTKRKDDALIRYLMRHEHGTPFEGVTLKFHIKAPIFVFRQWHRHRIGISINEQSARYSVLPQECYIPDKEQLKVQSKSNKQGRDSKELDNPEEIIQALSLEQAAAFYQYHEYLNTGLARELARINLPVSTYSEMYWQCNLRSLFAFCKLRCNPHAQYEIRVYANAMLELAKEVAPVACEAFEEYVLHAVTFSRTEMKVIKRLLNGASPTIKIIEEASLGKTLTKEFLKKLKD